MNNLQAYRMRFITFECGQWTNIVFLFFLEKTNKYWIIKDLRIYEGIYKQHLNIPWWPFRHPYALTHMVMYSSEFEVSLKASSGHWTQTHFVCQCQKKRQTIKLIYQTKNLPRFFPWSLFWLFLYKILLQCICVCFDLTGLFFALIWTATNLSLSLSCTFPSDLLMANFFYTNAINFWELRMLKVTMLCWLCKITLVVSLWGHSP